MTSLLLYSGVQIFAGQEISLGQAPKTSWVLVSAKIGNNPIVLSFVSAVLRVTSNSYLKLPECNLASISKEKHTFHFAHITCNFPEK